MKRTLTLLSTFLFISFSLGQTQLGAYIEDEEENLWKPSSLPDRQKGLELIHGTHKHLTFANLPIQNRLHTTNSINTTLGNNINEKKI